MMFTIYKASDYGYVDYLFVRDLNHMEELSKYFNNCKLIVDFHARQITIYDGNIE